MEIDKERANAQKEALIDCYIDKNDLGEEMSSLPAQDVSKYRESIFREVFMSKGSYCGNAFVRLGRRKVRAYVDAVKSQFGGELVLS